MQTAAAAREAEDDRASRAWWKWLIGTLVTMLGSASMYYRIEVSKRVELLERSVQRIETTVERIDRNSSTATAALLQICTRLPDNPCAPPAPPQPDEQQLAAEAPR